MSYEFSFISLQIFSSSLNSEKIIQKYGYVQEVGEDWLLESQFQFGNIFSVTLSPSRSNPPVVIVLPFPPPKKKIVPHSLNEQKCIGEPVRAGREG